MRENRVPAKLDLSFRSGVPSTKSGGITTLRREPVGIRWRKFPENIEIPHKSTGLQKERRLARFRHSLCRRE
jgi:hypothetical protein